MRFKKGIWLTVGLILLLVLTGCGQNQLEIFNAGMNMQNVKSLQDHTTMTFQMSGSGFAPAVQQQIDLTAANLNKTALDLNVKAAYNDDKTIGKSQMAINVTTQGQNISVPCWVYSDLTGSTPKVQEIFQIPQIAQGMIPKQFANKQYMVLDTSEMSSSELGTVDMAKLTEFSKNFQAEYIAFLNSYAQRFNPDINVESLGTQTIATSDGSQEAQVYQVKLTDAQLKTLIRYTVNNSLQDPEAVNFLKQFLDEVLAISKVPNQAQTISGVDQAFNYFEANKPQFLTQVTKVLDQLDNVSILGDNGLELKYAISGGYIIQKSGSLDFKINLAQVAQLMSTINGQQNSNANLNGTVNLQINFKTDISGINSSLGIDIPQVSSANSFSYFDLIKSMTRSVTGSNRLAGPDRYQTAKAIGEKYNSGVCSNIILASGNNYADSLSAGILSKKYDAPVLLVGATPEQSPAAFSYLAAHAAQDTKIYIIGGTGAVDKSFETALQDAGYANIERLSGNDRYDVNMAVVEKAGVEPGTPVFIVSGENFPDALSVSGYAGSKQYPIILAGQAGLSGKTVNYLTADKPSNVYIIGGDSVVAPAVEEQLKNLLPSAAIQRLAGNDRFATNSAVVNAFSDNPQTVYLANGFNYPDALLGGTLAAKDGNPILLIDNNSPTLPPAVQAYLQKLHDAGSHPQVTALGGTGVVADNLIQQANTLLNGK